MCLTFPAECVYIFTHRAIRAEGQWVTTATADGIDYLGDRQWWERMDEAVFVLFCFFPRRALDFSSLAVLLPFTTRGDYHSLCSKKERWKEMCAHVFQHLGQRCGRCSVHSSQLISCCQDVNRLLPSFIFYSTIVLTLSASPRAAVNLTRLLVLDKHPLWQSQCLHWKF